MAYITGTTQEERQYGSKKKVSFTATAGQTVFTPGFDYIPGSNVLEVYINGVKQAGSAYTESQNFITLAEGVQAGDIVEIVSDVVEHRLTGEVEWLRRNYGPYPSDPTQRPDGTAMVAGDEYFNSTLGKKKYFNGSIWVLDSATLNFIKPTVIGFDSTGVSDGEMIYFKGRDTIGDGGGGMFRYSASSTATVDGGTVIATVGGGRLIRELPLTLVSVTDFGILADGTTDNTAALINIAANSGKKMLVIPYGVKYSRAALMASVSMPDDVVFLDLSGINDFSASGETTKHFGLVSKDSAPDDTHWSIDSGHHAILALNNFGTAGTSSAAERKATQIWNVGQYKNGTEQQRGFRGAALLQFTKEGSSNYWVYQLRSLAPWQSIAGEYEEWRNSETITNTGVFRISNGQQYRSTSIGTTGSTAPSHTSGTVSDGGVNWLWIDSADRSVFNIREDGRVLFGAGNYGVSFRHKVSQTDPDGVYVFEGESRGISKTANHKLIPTNGVGDASPQPYLRAEDGGGLRVMKSDSSADVGNFTDTGGFQVRELRHTWATAVDLDNSPSVSGGITTLWVSNSAPTNIVGLDDGTDGQTIRLVFSNSNTTLVNSNTLMLSGSIDVTPTQYSVITFEKVPTSISDRWIEVSRSIK